MPSFHKTLYGNYCDTQGAPYSDPCSVTCIATKDDPYMDDGYNQFLLLHTVSMLVLYPADPKNFPWVRRMQVALGAAKGLAYLHDEERVKKVIYRDFKTSNILLDKVWAYNDNDICTVTCRTTVQSFPTLGWPLSPVLTYSIPPHFFLLFFFCFCFVLFFCFAGQPREAVGLWAGPCGPRGRAQPCDDQSGGHAGVRRPQLRHDR